MREIETEKGTFILGAPEVPQRVQLTDAQREAISINLRSVGFEGDIWRNPHDLPKVLHHSREAAAAVFAAILWETRETHRITMTFRQWCDVNHLPWR